MTSHYIFSISFSLVILVQGSSQSFLFFLFVHHIILAKHHSFKIQLFQVDLVLGSLFISSCLSFSIMDFWLFSIFFFRKKLYFLFLTCDLFCIMLYLMQELDILYLASFDLFYLSFDARFQFSNKALSSRNSIFFFGCHFSTHSLGSTTYLLLGFLSFLIHTCFNPLKVILDIRSSTISCQGWNLTQAVILCQNYQGNLILILCQKTIKERRNKIKSIVRDNSFSCHITFKRKSHNLYLNYSPFNTSIYTSLRTILEILKG